MLYKVAAPLNPFHPWHDHNQITVINSRSARPLDCLANLPNPEWSAISASVSADPQRVFASKVVNRGATETNWALLELDRAGVEAAFQISVANGRLTSAEISPLRLKADKQLFRNGGRSFVMVHNHPHTWVLEDTEPTLVSQAHGSGCLIGISMAPALGMKPGEIGLLMFEDRVCDTDASYAVVLHWKDLSKRGFFSTTHSHHFTFGGECNPLTIIASVYQPTLPSPPYEGAPVRVRNVTLSAGDMLSLAKFAWGIVSFLLKL
jgi:hypothetical protein